MNGDLLNRINRIRYLFVCLLWLFFHGFNLAYVVIDFVKDVCSYVVSLFAELFHILSVLRRDEAKVV
jgi:hypothetical protein